MCFQSAMILLMSAIAPLPAGSAGGCMLTSWRHSLTSTGFWAERKNRLRLPPGSPRESSSSLKLMKLFALETCRTTPKTRMTERTVRTFAVEFLPFPIACIASLTSYLLALQQANPAGKWQRRRDAAVGQRRCIAAFLGHKELNSAPGSI